MNRCLTISILFLGLCSFSGPSAPADKAFTMKLCKSGHGGDVTSGDLLYNGHNIGSVVAINHDSQRIRHKRFAIKDLGGSVNNRYKAFRRGQESVLISSYIYPDCFSSNKKTLRVKAALYLVGKIILVHLGHVDWLGNMCKMFTHPN